MKSEKISRTMMEALRAMAETGAKIVWNYGNNWLLAGEKVSVVGRSYYVPSCTVSAALERRGLISKSYPPPDHRTTYTITEKGKAAVK